ncbi:BatD family protein [Rhodopirellula bahusiensis]|uniref:BatD protein n=1 Tax=Rhodopirellula bahusiensis TaxID=2014065 RepID=A0A2G1WDJ6_9BACT|nr:BatD family protein [Rhodopirellula bahusiensis]PHQ37091.1 BatD protein [Rhodopirellula bahusiensis]
MQSIEVTKLKRQCASPVIWLLCVVICCVAFVIGGETNAADVSAKLSSMEAYVGASLTLQIRIENAQDYELPELPQIDGVQIVREGSPQQSRNIVVISGRMIQEQSVTFLYKVTPAVPGTYEIPPIGIRVDGDVVETEPLNFVATVSETGDLLFVEIEGEESSVYVGEPIRLTLKIWLRPFRLADYDVTLSDGDMWSLRSSQVEWGEFGKALEEMRGRNQRPGGRSVLREDQNGQSHEYYLYEIDTEIYPKKPGKVDVGDVEIVFNYPVKIGPARRRDPLGMGSVFDDDFFRSPFDRPQLAIQKSRPIRAKAKFNSIDVLPIPTEGRPAGYNGAVGKYEIVTQATPDSVEAGDPVKLKIGITGDGPMELVRCPRLSTMPELTTDFKVSDQPLPGFVQDNMKVFAPTIRPKHEGVTKIPPIEFHFFNPETESFEVARSKPISLRVRASETLQLNSIVSNSDPPESQGSTNGAGQGGQNAKDSWASSLWQIHSSPRSLKNIPVQHSYSWWLAVAPGLVWLSLVVWQSRSRWMTWLPEWKSPAQRALAELESASDESAIGQAMATYLQRQFGSKRESSSWLSGVGGLRAAGGYGLAAEVESFLESCQREETAISSESTTEISELRSRGAELIEQLEIFCRHQRPSRRTQAKDVPAFQSRSVARILGWVLAGCSFVFASDVSAGEPMEGVTLDQTSMSVLFQEANQSYERGMAMLKRSGSDAASANDLVGEVASGQADAKAEFALAATRYQTLVDAGVENPQLYANLGNACLQSGQIGRAIVAYERALKFHPENDSIRTRLWLARDQVNESSDLDVSWKQQAQRAIAPILFRHWSSSRLRWSVISLAFAFWAVLISLRIGRWTPEARRVAHSMVSLIAVIAVCGGAIWWLSTAAISKQSTGFIVADQVTVRAGDSESFPALIEWNNADGRQVHVIQSRGNWSLIRTASTKGWIPQANLQVIAEG